MILRDAEPIDLGYIIKSWLINARQLRTCVRRSVFDAFYPDVVRAHLELNRTKVLSSEDKLTVHAWACGKAPNLLHFAYVPSALRGNGLGRRVIEAVLEGYPPTIFVTSSPLSLPHHERFIYNPYVGRPSL